MKHITKLFLLAILFVFASCQNETLTEGTSSITEDELALENEIIVSDGEEDETFVLDDDSETMPFEALSFNLSSNLSSGGSPNCTPDIESVELSLPDNVTVDTLEPECNVAYFGLNIAEGDLAGNNISAWCSDIEAPLDINETVTYDVYSSYEDLTGLENLFANLDKFDEVNWVLNQSFIGKESGILNDDGENYIYTYGHIQSAIWQLIDNTSCSGGDCYFLTCPTLGQWSSDDALMSDEIVAAAESQDGFIPQCGQQIAIILVSATKQSLIITKEVPEKEIPCSDCEGKVTELELEFDWGCAKRVKIYQKKINSCRGIKVFDKVLQPGEKFVLDTDQAGAGGNYAYIYINHCYYTKIKINCDVKVGPGYTKGVFNVISGESSNGGELCEYVKPDYNKCYRHWRCKYYSKCRYRH